MKNIFTILLFLLISLFVFSLKGNTTTYYFSTTDGDDSRTSAQAQNSSTPWKTISKLNSFFSSLQPGDQVLFKRGDTFYGSIIATKSGNSSSPITFDAYGSGANPIITGLTTISAWTSVGSGLYQATVPGGLSTLNIVAFDGAFQPIGKMPKGNKGYYTVNSVGSNSITSSGLAGLPSYVGGEICWRAYHWVLWRGTVTSQSSTSVSYTPFASTSGGSTENPQANYGFFFQNSPAACTQLGDWAYNSSSHVLTMYFGSVSPTSHTVQASTIDNLVTSSSTSSYLSFNNLSVKGGNTCLFSFAGSTNIKINSCDLSLAGLYGIFGNGSSTNWSVTNNTVSYCNSIGIYASSSATAWTVSGNTILNIAAVAGMGGSGENQYFGMKIRNGSTITLNTVRNTGYIPIMFTGTNNLIQNNVVDSFGFVKDDAGGIYCGVDNLSGSKITGNIVTRGIGCPSGTPDQDMRAQGIYIDDGASNVEISGNTAAFCGRSGIYIHNAHEVNIHDNTLFDNNSSSIAYYNDGGTIANITFQNNINFAKTSSELVYQSSGSSNSPTTYFATLDNNFYCRPINETSTFWTSSGNYSLSTWKSFIGKDANSKITPKTITDTSQLKFYYNSSSSLKTFSFGATYIDAKNTSYAGSITLQPFTSAVLVYVSGTVSNQAPLANAGPDQNITLPVNTVTLNGTGSDADGSIASYQWTKISGPTQFTIASPNAGQTAVNSLVQGVYQFQLTVTDNQGATGKDTMTLTVNAAANKAPIANAGTNQVIVLPTNTSTLNGSGSTDADGSITAYNWLEVSGPSSATISNPSAASTSVGSLVQGVYQFVLTVTDNQGATGKDTVSITVNAATDQPPVANAGLDLNITLPLNSVTLSGTGSDADGSIISYQWTKISGPTQFTIVSPTQSQTVVNNLVKGVYKFAFEVTDNNGVATSDTVQVVVNPAPPNLAPVANAGLDINVTLPTNTVVLNGSGTDADGTIASYQWSRVSGPSQYLIVSPSQTQTTVNNLLQGTYQFVLTVTDNQGATGTDTVNVFVNPAPNQPPTAAAGPDIDITLPTNTATLNGSGSDPDGSIASYQWTKISGPTQFTISTPTRATTTLSNLVQGVYQFELQVTDDQGATGKDTIIVTVHAAAPAPNQPPTANAGPDLTITLPTNSVTLNGSGTDADGTIASYQWTEISGPADDIISPTQARTSVTNLVQGVYLLQLTVTDNNGATGSDTVQIVVNPSNQLPTANAGADINIALPVNTVTLNGSGSDPDGTIASYQWTMVSGPSQYSIVTPTQAQTTVNNLAQGVYQFQLMVTDNQGATGKDTVTVVVNLVPNQSPTANAGPDITITLPTNSVTLNGSGNDADGSVSSYQWTRISGPTQYTMGSATKAQTTVSNLVQGVYKFELKVTDNKSATGTDTVTVTVNAAPNQPPKANAGPDITIQLPTNSATLNGSGSDPDGSISSYQWRIISGPTQYAIRSATRATATVSNLVQGVYQFELKVTDNNGATATDTMIITVNAANVPPTANAGTNITITLPTNTVTLSGSATDVDGTIASYQWTRISGPGQYSIVSPTLAQTKVNNLVQGTYQFQLRVTDNKGATGTATVTVTVNAAPNQPPTANAGSNIVITLPTNTVTLNGSGSDPDGTISSYQWTKLSGPTQYTIASSGQRQTAVNNLVQGVYQFQLTVTDNKGATGTATVTVTVNAAPNQAPTANAGADITITLPTNSVTLTGSGTDADGTIASYQWTKVSGPTQYTVATPTQAQTVINNLVQGVYQFQLKVTDNQGATGTATVTVIVNAAPNQYPTANAGTDITITLPTNAVTLNGSGNDPDGTIASYQWTKVSGPLQFTIANPGQAQTAVNNLVQGVYQFELKVTDNQGAVATSTITVTVIAAAKQPPTANTGNDITITLPTNSVTLNGSGSDPDGTISSYQWIKMSGPNQFTIVSPAQAQTVVNNLVQGVYQFQLKVTDNQGATGTATITVTVNAAPNQPPTANAGADITITLPTNNVTLSGSGTDPDGTIVSYAWRNVSGPSQFTVVDANQAQTAVNNLVQGVYAFELTVTDNSGAMTTDTVVVTVNSTAPSSNQSPTANAGNDITISLPTDSVTLNGSGNDPDGTIASYQWINIAGPFQFNIVGSAQAQTKVTGLVAGVYEFELQVTDNSGATGRDTVFVTVNPASVQTFNQAPEANAGPDINITLPNNSAILAGSGSDPEGVISSYQWRKISGPSGFMASSMRDPQLTLSNLAAGVYQFELLVTDSAGRFAKDTANVTVNAKLNSKAKIYPNPATNMINVQISSTTPTNYTSMRIYDSKGNIVYRENFERTQQTVTRQINVSTFINGVYYLELNIDNNTMTTLIFVKQ